jgi:hypothetical protein
MIDTILDVSRALDAVERSQRAMVALKAISSPRTDTLASTEHRRQQYADPQLWSGVAAFADQ